MVHIRLPKNKSDDFWEQLPAHRQKVDALFESGTIQIYSVSDDLRNVWTVIEAQGEWEAKNIVGAFPLFPFYENVQIQSLRFHESSQMKENYLYMN